MKKKNVASIIAGLTLAFATQISFADETPATLLDMSKILQNLNSKGYNIVRKVELEHGMYEAETINTQGNEIKIQINAQTGEITSPKESNKQITMLDAVKKVETEGYHNISKIKSEHGNYEIKALDKDGKKVELKVDASTGKINKAWF